MNDFKEWLSDYLRYFLLGFAILAVLVIAGGGIVIYKKLADPAPRTQTSDTVKVETETPEGQGNGTDATEPESIKDETNSPSEPVTEGTTDAQPSTETESGNESEAATEGTTGTSESGENGKDPEYLKVTTTLNFRTAPDGEVITSYGAGRIVKFLGREGNWYKVRVGGRDGYMSSAYLEEVPYEAGMENEVETEPDAGTTAQSEPIYKTLKGTCYLRADTSKDSQILGTYNAGASIQFLEDVGGWYRVQVDGMTGYMGAQFF